MLLKDFHAKLEALSPLKVSVARPVGPRYLWSTEGFDGSQSIFTNDYFKVFKQRFRLIQSNSYWKLFFCLEKKLRTFFLSKEKRM